MSPLPPGTLEQLLQTLPPERPDPFSHLETLTPDQLLWRRVEVSGQIKTLEEERQAIDAVLLELFSESELRIGVSAPGGWVLRSRSRTSWAYDSEIREAIKSLQKQAQRDGRAQPMANTYLCLTQES